MGIQSKAHRERFSQLRQGLVRLRSEVGHLLQPYLFDKPVIKGSVYELRRKCGKAGCKCAQGQLHPRMVLSASDKGRTKLRVIPAGFLSEVQIKVGRYQKLRRARARLVEVHKELLRIMDEMEAMRREEIPASKKKSSEPRH